MVPIEKDDDDEEELEWIIPTPPLLFPLHDVSVSKTSLLSFLIDAILLATMVYRASALRGLAIAQMVFGALMVVFGVACIFSVDNWTSYVGFGIWVGVWVSSCSSQI